MENTKRIIIPITDVMSIAYVIKKQAHKIYMEHIGKKGLKVHLDPDTAIFYITYIEDIARVSVVVKPDMKISGLEKTISSFIIHDIHKMGIKKQKMSTLIDLGENEIEYLRIKAQKKLENIIKSANDEEIKKITNLIKERARYLFGANAKDILSKHVILFLLNSRFEYSDILVNGALAPNKIVHATEKIHDCDWLK